MGKIRTKVLGSEEEQKQKKHDKARREGKKLQKKAGGEKLVETEKTAIVEPIPQAETPPAEKTAEESKILSEIEGKPKKEKKKKEEVKKVEGRNYRQVKTYVDRTKKYPLNEAIKLVKKTSYTKFDGSVETHINTLEKGLRGTVIFPHGTGKTIRVAIASDDLVKEIEAGKINFDVLIATPLMMPKLAKLAKVLGPKGLMPNPKSGTITTDPETLKTKLSKGQTQFKTEINAPIIHLVIGKVSFTDNKLEENLKALLDAVGSSKINSVTLNCTMGPGIKVLLEK